MIPLQDPRTVSEIPNISTLSMSDDYQVYKLGHFKLQQGGEIPDAFIAYKVLGDLSLPAIVYPTWYSGCESRLPRLFSIAADKACASDFRQFVAHRL